MKLKIRPVTLHNHPQTAAVAALAAVKAVKAPLVRRSYQQLVTRQGVHPSRAMQLLGFTK